MESKNDDSEDNGSDFKSAVGNPVRRAYTNDEFEAKSVSDETVSLPPAVEKFMVFSMSEELTSVSKQVR